MVNSSTSDKSITLRILSRDRPVVGRTELSSPSTDVESPKSLTHTIESPGSSVPDRHRPADSDKNLRKVTIITNLSTNGICT